MLRSSIITPRDEILAANESENRITKHAYDHDSVETIFWCRNICSSNKMCFKSISNIACFFLSICKCVELFATVKRVSFQFHVNTKKREVWNKLQQPIEMISFYRRRFSCLTWSWTFYVCALTPRAHTLATRVTFALESMQPSLHK